MTERKVEIVAISKIEADADQPRRNFTPERMADLIQSIKQHGIMNPMIVEKLPTGGYLLVDGERRYRAATELKLKDVPIIVVSNQSPTDRLIRQFHLQEQHEGWSAVEKANAVGTLAKAMKVSIEEMGKMLSLPKRTVGEYMAFHEILDKKTYEKMQTSVAFAARIVGVRKYITNLFEAKDLEFTRDQQEALEAAIVNRIKSGDIRKAVDINKVRDAAKISLDSILKYIKNDKMTTQRLFIEADAKVASHYRNTLYSAHALEFHVQSGIPLKMGSMLTEANIKQLKRTRDWLGTLLGSNK